MSPIKRSPKPANPIHNPLRPDPVATNGVEPSMSVAGLDEEPESQPEEFPGYDKYNKVAVEDLPDTVRQILESATRSQLQAREFEAQARLLKSDAGRDAGAVLYQVRGPVLLEGRGTWMVKRMGAGQVSSSTLRVELARRGVDPGVIDAAIKASVSSGTQVPVFVSTRRAGEEREPGSEE